VSNAGPTQSFKDIDAAKWSRIKAVILEKTGITITDDNGTSPRVKGIIIAWTYNPKLLSLLVSRKSFDPTLTVVDPFSGAPGALA
jgi:hypothetical protein